MPKKVKYSKKQLREIAEKYQLADIYLFGSLVLGHSRPESDFDLAVRFKRGLPKPEEIPEIYGNLFADLSLVFKKKKIDLVFLEELRPHFQFKIISEGELIYSDSLNDSYNFQEKVINFYRDYKYFIDEYFKGVLESA